MKKLDWLFLILIAFLALIGVQALFHPGFYTSHDGEHQIVRLIHFFRGLKDGQFPVRWAGPPAFDGYGYPLFIFTYRFPFYLGSFFKILNFSYSDSIKAVFILTYLLSGIFMYLCQKKIWRQPVPAFLGSVFYLFAPWRFSVILVRASLGEAVCFLFFPLVLWSLFSLTEKEKSFPLFLGAFSLAGLLLSHAMLTFLFMPFLFVLVFFLSCHQPKVSLSFLKLLFLALGLSAFYWLPASVEKKNTVFGNEIGGYYQQHFVTLKQLIYSPWGYGLSHPGSERDEMSFQVGIAQWLAIFLTILLLIWQRLQVKKIDFHLQLISLFVLFISIMIFLMTSASNFFWQVFSKLFEIDFPFRFLALTTLFSSILAGGLIVSLKRTSFPKIFLYPVAFGLLVLTLYGNRNHLRANLYTYFTDTDYEKSPSSTNSYGEYRAKWVVSAKDLPKKEGAMVIKYGEAEIKPLVIKSNLQKFQINVQKESLFQINTMFYPGWRLFVNNQRRQIDIGPIYGLIHFSAHPGDREVVFKFCRTWDRLTGESLTLFSLLFIIYFSSKLWLRKK